MLDDANVSPEAQKSRLIRRGGQAALSEIATEFGEKLFDTLLWEIMAQPLIDAYPSGESVPLEQEREQGQTIIDCPTIIRSLANHSYVPSSPHHRSLSHSTTGSPERFFVNVPLNVSPHSVM